MQQLTHRLLFRSLEARSDSLTPLTVRPDWKYLEKPGDLPAEEKTDFLSLSIKDRCALNPWLLVRLHFCACQFVLKFQ